MATTEPIRNPEQIEQMKQYLLDQKGIKYYTLFTVGINLVLRISDLLLIKWGDVLAKDMKTYKQLKLTEKKTKKKRSIKLNSHVVSLLEEYRQSLETINLNDYIFGSGHQNNKPITHCQFLKEVNYAIARKEIKLPPINTITVKDLQLSDKIQKYVLLRGQVYWDVLKTVVETNLSLLEVLQLTVKEAKEMKLDVSTKGLNDEDYIFKKYGNNNKPLDPSMVWKVFNEAADYVGINENVGTHSLRKSWVYNANKNGVPPVTILEVGNWSNWERLKDYAGITQDEINEVYDNMIL